MIGFFTVLITVPYNVPHDSTDAFLCAVAIPFSTVCYWLDLVTAEVLFTSYECYNALKE